MFKGIIFDFNGTLFEDKDLQEDAWGRVIFRHFSLPMSTAEFQKNFLGLGNPDILVYINSLDPDRQFDISITDEKESVYRDICRETPDRLKLLPGVTETLDALKAAGIPMAIATASEITNVDFYYEIFGLDRWFGREQIIYDDRTFPIKPAPDIYLKAAERLGLAPADCVICEDSRNGLLAAKAAGAGRIIARRSDPDDTLLYQDPAIFAVIDDFTGFYPKFLEN